MFQGAGGRRSPARTAEVGLRTASLQSREGSQAALASGLPVGRGHGQDGRRNRGDRWFRAGLVTCSQREERTEEWKLPAPWVTELCDDFSALSSLGKQQDQLTNTWG